MVLPIIPKWRAPHKNRTGQPVRIGDAEVYEADAVVMHQGMPFVLLGNSDLNRFQMRRANDRMVLERWF